jgi:hypothetical protein
VRLIAVELGMQPVDEDSDWIINWMDTGVSFERILEM